MKIVGKSNLHVTPRFIINGEQKRKFSIYSLRKQPCENLYRNNLNAYMPETKRSYPDLYEIYSLSNSHEAVAAFREQARILKVSVSEHASSCLARCFLEHLDAESKLSTIIFYLHRNLIFNPYVFLRMILRETKRALTELLIRLHAVASPMRNIISPGMVFDVAEFEDVQKLVDGLRRMAEDGLGERAFNDYVASLIQITYSSPSSALSHQISLNIYEELIRPDLASVSDWLIQTPRIAVYFSIVNLLGHSHPIWPLSETLQQACLLKELMRSCLRCGVSKETIWAKDIISTVRVLFEDNSKAYKAREIVLKVFIGSSNSTSNLSSSLRMEVLRLIGEHARKYDPTISYPSLLALFRTLCSFSSSIPLKKEITTIITKIIQDALTDSSEYGTVFGLLLARIWDRCGWELDQENAPTKGGRGYESWFLCNFVDEENPLLQPKRVAQTFFGALENMVPFEEAYMLQFHGKALLHFQKHKAIIGDYITLVKTRLLDMGYDHTLRGPATLARTATIFFVESTPEGLDVPTVLSLFAQTKKVPAKLGEAIVIRARWYNDTFLPALLDSNVEPEEKEFVEAREELVEILGGMGKIPLGKWKEWKQKIRKTEEIDTRTKERGILQLGVPSSPKFSSRSRVLPSKVTTFTITSHKRSLPITIPLELECNDVKRIKTAPGEKNELSLPTNTSIFLTDPPISMMDMSTTNTSPNANIIGSNNPTSICTTPKRKNLSLRQPKSPDSMGRTTNPIRIPLTSIKVSNGHNSIKAP